MMHGADIDDDAAAGYLLQDIANREYHSGRCLTAPIYVMNRHETLLGYIQGHIIINMPFLHLFVGKVVENLNLPTSSVNIKLYAGVDNLNKIMGQGIVCRPFFRHVYDSGTVRLRHLQLVTRIRILTQSEDIVCMY